MEPGLQPVACQDGSLQYAKRSLIIHVTLFVCYIGFIYSQLDLVGILCFYLHLAIFAIYGLLLSRASTEQSWRKRLDSMNAFGRVATLLCYSVALPSWSVPSGSCTPDFWRYLLLHTGILGLTCNTLHFPLPGIWQLPVHAATAAVFVQLRSSRACGLILGPSPQLCNHRGHFAALWPWISGAGQSFAGLLHAHIDQDRLSKLDIQEQCHVGVVWLQLCLGGLFPCLLQCALGFDRTLHRFLDELPGFNKVFVYAAMSMQLIGLLWTASYFWGLSLLDQRLATGQFGL